MQATKNKFSSNVQDFCIETERFPKLLLKGSLAFMQHFKFVNWRIRGFVFWCPEQVKSRLQYWLMFDFFFSQQIHGIFFLKTSLKYFSISGGSIETRRQEDVLHRFCAMKRKSESVLQKRPQDFENSVKFDENANVFLEWFYWLYTFEYKYFNLDGKPLIYL